MSEPFKKCDKDGMCKFLMERLVSNGKGFNPVMIMNMTNNTTYFKGVCYKTSAKDGGLMLNYCPFCGGTPGTLNGKPK